MQSNLTPNDLAAVEKLAAAVGGSAALGVIPARSLVAQGLARITADYGGSMVTAALTEDGYDALAATWGSGNA